MFSERGAVSAKSRNNLPEIGVVILSKGSRETWLKIAIDSVCKQEYLGPISILIIGDGYYPHNLSLYHRQDGLSLEIAFLSNYYSELPTVSRVARLRNEALSLTKSPLVCFLDDDNWWESNHLETLYELIIATDLPAVHSWRRLVDTEGRPWSPRFFPWLPLGVENQRVYTILTEGGLMYPKSPVVRDQVSFIVDDKDYGMVDMGEWLFKTKFLRNLGFDTEYTQKELKKRITEDDKLLTRIREMNIIPESTCIATLNYRCGGYSNPVEEIG